jgi:hypothetical protein
MNAKPKTIARPDLDVAMFDFAGEYAQDPERALYRLQFLLLDEDTCLARVAFLRTLAASAGRKSSSLDARQTVEAFHAEIALLCEEGVFAVHAAGRLTSDWVRRLDRLTRNPEALLEVHRRLVDEDEPGGGSASANVATKTKGDTATSAGLTGFTALARAGRVADLEERLRPWLPYVLRRAGLARDLDESLAQQFLAYIRTRINEVRQRSFRELLPAWLADFAPQLNLADQLRADQLQPTEADAVEQVLRHPGENESAWAKAFRESALGGQIQTAQELLAFETTEVRNVPALPNYRRDLFREARRAYRDGLELFECEVPLNP